LVVLEFQGAVKGVQFDRYGAMWLGGVELLRTTTPEPDTGVAQGIAWDIEKDVTEYSSLFSVPSQAALAIPNVVDQTYTGVEYIEARLVFYAASASSPAPLATPLIMPLDDPTSDPFGKMTSNGNSTHLRMAALPAGNIRTAFLDLYASGHSTEEFWYGTDHAYREIDLYIDGVLAGAHFPFPVLYTGGMCPLLWRPLTGILSFDIPAYRFDITPFLGMLNDQRNHTYQVVVVDGDAKGAWYIDGVLVLYKDESSTQLTGALTNHSSRLDPANPFKDPARTVTVQHVRGAGGHGSILTNGTMSYTVTGTLHAVGDSSNSITTSVSGDLRSTNFNQDVVTRGSMLATTSVASYKSNSAADRGAGSTRVSVHEYPYSLVTIEGEDKFTGTFLLNATVNITRRRAETAFASKSILAKGTIGATGTTGDDEQTVVLDVEWENSIQSHAVYNRSETNHTLVYIEEGHSTEDFWIDDGTAGRCYSHAMVADQGFVTSDVHTKGKGNSTAGCQRLGGGRFCGSELCGLP
jgi:hypothetical protein